MKRPIFVSIGKYLVNLMDVSHFNFDLNDPDDTEIGITKISDGYCTVDFDDHEAAVKAYQSAVELMVKHGLLIQ